MEGVAPRVGVVGLQPDVTDAQYAQARMRMRAQELYGLEIKKGVLRQALPRHEPSATLGQLCEEPRVEQPDWRLIVELRIGSKERLEPDGVKLLPCMRLVIPPGLL